METGVAHGDDVGQREPAVADQEDALGIPDERPQPVPVPSVLQSPPVHRRSPGIGQDPVRGRGRLRVGSGRCAQVDRTVGPAVVVDRLGARSLVKVRRAVDGAVGVQLVLGDEPSGSGRPVGEPLAVGRLLLAVPLVDVQQLHPRHELALFLEPPSHLGVDRRRVERHEGGLHPGTLGEQAVAHEQGSRLASRAGADHAAQRQVASGGHLCLRHGR